VLLLKKWGSVVLEVEVRSVELDGAVVLKLVEDHIADLVVSAVRIVVEFVVVDHTLLEMVCKLSLMTVGHTVLRACDVYAVGHKMAWEPQSAS